VDRGGHWLGLADIGTAALAAGKQVDDLGAQAREETAIGQSSLQLGRLEDAHARLQRVLALHRQAGDRVGQGVSHRHLAHLQSRQGQPEQALDHARQTLTWFQAAGHRLGQARALNTSAGCTPNSATSDRLSLTAKGALSLAQELDDTLGLATIWAMPTPTASAPDWPRLVDWRGTAIRSGRDRLRR
jgi:tetratricopeptide repeat protein